MEYQGLQARQALIPSNAPPRLDFTRLPLIDLTSRDIIQDIINRRRVRHCLQIIDGTDKNATKILMTPMRDARVAGPILQEAH
jgi:hypothetical protein